MRILSILAAAGLALSVSLLPATAQSYNCDYAQKPAEIAICDSRHLSRLDSRMARLYYDLLNEGLSPRSEQRLRDDQRDWLDERNRCGYDRGCLRRAYRGRIDELRDY